MRRLPCILLAIAAAFTLIGCGGRGVSRAMELADSLMETDPERSLVLLDSLGNADSTGQVLTSDALRARHALLSSQARYKCYIYDTDDSVISTAVDYYQRHGSDFDRIRAYFYDGVINYNASEYDRAIVPALKAQQIADRLGESLWRARTAELLANIYYKSHYSQKAVENYQKARRLYSLSGKEINALFSTIDLANAYYAYKPHQSAIALLDSVCDSVMASGDPVLISYWNSTLLPFLQYTNQDERAYQTVLTLKALSPYYTPTTEDYSNFSKTYQALGDNEQALAMIDSAKLTVADSAELLSWYVAAADFFGNNDDFEKANAYKDSILRFQRKTIDRLLDQSVLAQEELMYQHQAQVNASRASNRLLLIVLIIIVALCATTIGVVLHRRRVKRIEIELERKIEFADNLAHTIEMLEARFDALPHNQKVSNVAESLKSKLLLCKEVLALGAVFIASPSRTDAADKIKERIGQLSENATVEAIMTLVNLCGDNVLDNLQSEFPDIPKRYLHFLALVYAGLNKDDVCRIMDISDASFYQLRRRVKTSLTTAIGATKATHYLDFKL